MRGAALHRSLFEVEEIPQPARKGRSAELIARRNELFIDRFSWYTIYHNELRFEVILESLQKELFLEVYTLGKMVGQFYREIKVLRDQQPTVAYFKNKWPHLRW